MKNGLSCFGDHQLLELLKAFKTLASIHSIGTFCARAQCFVMGTKCEHGLVILATLDVYMFCEMLATEACLALNKDTDYFGLRIGY